MSHRDVVIIGGGPAGRVVIHALRHAGSDLSITLIKDEPVNVNRCAVPYGISNARPLVKYQIPNELVTDFGAELVIDRVESIDPAGSSVRLAGGSTIDYDHLVLATGAKPIVPPIPGIDAEGVTPVRSLDDLSRLRDLAARSKRAVIVGGGYIGIEVAVVLRSLGLEVAIVEMLDHVMQLTGEPELVPDVERDLTEHGISLFTGARVVEFATRDGALSGVRLEDGRTIDADFAVVSIGVTPDVELAKDAGIETTKFGIVTDDHLRTGAPNIYASGDCAEKKSFITGRPTRGEFGTNAVFMSKVVAANILGGDMTFPGVLNASATTTFDLSFGSAGLIEQTARRDGLDVVTGFSEVLDRYPMMDHVAPIRTKLVVEEPMGRIVGGSVLRRGFTVAGNVDFLSFAIQMNATIDDLVKLQYATHPELAAKPSDNLFTFTAKDARTKLRRPAAV